MKIRKINRYGHEGRSWQEKEAYKNFLTSKLHLDKTESDPADINKTNESSFEEEKIEPTKVTKKSKWLKLKDFLYASWVVAILSGVILLVIGGYIVMNREQGVQGEKISTIEKNIREVNTGSQTNTSNYNQLKNAVDVFKEGVLKDMEFIKKLLKF